MLILFLFLFLASGSGSFILINLFLFSGFVFCILLIIACFSEFTELVRFPLLFFGVWFSGMLGFRGGVEGVLQAGMAGWGSG